jgi:class 3 adenylate cyclase
MATPPDTQATAPRRELAAIMFSDIAGYTAIMGRDEERAIRALGEHRELLQTLLPRFNGRMLGEIGDGTLTIFHRASDAVNCAREVQSTIKDSKEFQLRIGIHLGDVLFADDKAWGDGVNIASRIHALAPPGSICVSAAVYDEIRNKPGMALALDVLEQRPLEQRGRGQDLFESASRVWPVVRKLKSCVRSAPSASSLVSNPKSAYSRAVPA